MVIGNGKNSLVAFARGENVQKIVSADTVSMIVSATASGKVVVSQIDYI